MKNILFSIDVEPDLHTNNYKSLIDGIPKIVYLLDKYNIKATFFVTCDCIEKYPKIFRQLIKQGHEIALHGYRHERFDYLTLKQKEESIKKSIFCFKKYLNIKPKGFRAPQHSIDNETLSLLEKYNFKYDSSYHPLNLLQLFFFPKKIKLWWKLFFSPLNPYKIRKNLIEIPTSSFIIPFVSLTVRVMPLFLLKFYIKIIKIFYKMPIFYAHSWDFIEIKESKTTKLCSNKKFEKNLEEFLKYSSKKLKYVKIEDLISK